MMRVKEEVIDVLANSEIKDNLLYLPNVQLDRKMYQDVNKILASIGGKWNAKQKAHIFAESPEDIIEQVIQTGEHTDTKKEFQFFETPKLVSDRMLKLANIKKGEKVLEPSAGRGKIAQYVSMTAIDLIELEPSNREYLIGEGYNVVGENFLDFNERYDVIVANPPFSRQQDIDHINHMIDLADRCVVAIASSSVLFRTNKKTVEFRERIESLGGYIELLPESSFKESGTSVNTCLVYVDLIK